MNKVSKSKARTAYANGKRIFLCPSKLNLDTYQKISITLGIDPTVSGPFDQAVDIFRANECNRQTGLVVHFYIP